MKLAGWPLSGGAALKRLAPSQRANLPEPDLQTCPNQPANWTLPGTPLRSIDPSGVTASALSVGLAASALPRELARSAWALPHREFALVGQPSLTQGVALLFNEQPARRGKARARSQLRGQSRHHSCTCLLSHSFLLIGKLDAHLFERGLVQSARHFQAFSFLILLQA